MTLKNMKKVCRIEEMNCVGGKRHGQHCTIFELPKQKGVQKMCGSNSAVCFPVDEGRLPGGEGT